MGVPSMGMPSAAAPATAVLPAVVARPAAPAEFAERMAALLERPVPGLTPHYRDLLTGAHPHRPGGPPITRRLVPAADPPEVTPHHLATVGPGPVTPGRHSRDETPPAPPASPIEPVAPVGPVEPVAPVGPVEPVGQGGPVGQVASMSAVNAVRAARPGGPVLAVPVVLDDRPPPVGANEQTVTMSREALAALLAQDQRR
jgi:hypothetical protein